MIDRIRTAALRHFEVRRATRELSFFSDRDLRDIGIRRADIPRLVRGGDLTGW